MSLKFLLWYFQLGIFKGATNLGAHNDYVRFVATIGQEPRYKKENRRRSGKQKPKRTMRHFLCGGSLLALLTSG